MSPELLRYTLLGIITLLIILSIATGFIGFRKNNKIIQKTFYLSVSLLIVGLIGYKLFGPVSYSANESSLYITRSQEKKLDDSLQQFKEIRSSFDNPDSSSKLTTATKDIKSMSDYALNNLDSLEMREYISEDTSILLKKLADADYDSKTKDTLLGLSAYYSTAVLSVNHTQSQINKDQGKATIKYFHNSKKIIY